MDYYDNPEHQRRQLHIEVDFDVYMVGEASSLKQKIRRALNSIMLFGEKGVEGSRISNYQITVTELNPRVIAGLRYPRPAHIKISFDSWTTISPKQFGSKPFWISTNMPLNIMGRLNEIEAMRRRTNFRIVTSGEWEDEARTNYPERAIRGW